MIHAISEGPQTGVVISPIADHYFPSDARREVFYRLADRERSDFQGHGDACAHAHAHAHAYAYAYAYSDACACILAKPTPTPASTPNPAPAPASKFTRVPLAASHNASALAKEAPVDQVGFIVTSQPSVFTDKIPAATDTSIAFTITNGTGKAQVFHIFFYKADADFSKTKILREDRQEIKADGSVEIAPYLFTEPGIYRLNVKTADNTQLMQRTWKVVDIRMQK